MSDTASDLRRRQNKRDESIRLKMEKDLAKKRPTAARQRSSRSKAAPGTVSALRPSPPMTVPQDMTVHEAAQLMAAKREDCVLVISDESHLSGIFTAKDLAFRVIAAGLKPSATSVQDIMTPNPMCTRIDTSATEALDLMVTRGFRHLPVVDEEGDVSGVLDITKCFYEAMSKLERAYDSSKKLYEALEGVQTEMGTAHHQPAPIIEYVESLKKRMAGPDLASVLDGRPPAWVTVKTSVREATQLMKDNHTTAVLVMDGQNLAGIFTSKDVVLRVVAPGLDAANCSVVRVMTPHPDCAPSTLSIQQALRKMNDGHYLNLPVTDEEDTIVGMVDVLKLTYATLNQVNSMGGANGSTDEVVEEEGPMWNKFWGAANDDGEDTGSVISGSDTPSRSFTGPATTNPTAPTPSTSVINPFSDHIPPLPVHQASNTPNREEDSPVKPGDSVSALESGDVFSFKFKAPGVLGGSGGRIHRFACAPDRGIDHVKSVVKDRLSADELSEVSNDFGVSYVDDDGDVVLLATDDDLAEAVVVARRASKDKLQLYIHHPRTRASLGTRPNKSLLPEMPSTPSPAAQTKHADSPTLKAPAGTNAAEKRRAESSSSAAASSKQPLDVSTLLLPGAIALLAVAVVGVFVASRSSKS
ncbi:hypothetical protein PYCC9005_001375 [Savitreella phatthalungensis]